jgi:diacylglycerol kinase (ATP)
MSVAPAALDLHRPRRIGPRSAEADLLLVANANASGLGGRRALVDQVGSLLSLDGARVETRITRSIEEVEELLHDEGNARRLVLLGGDGTLHAIANVPGPKYEVALLPAGRANNVARSLGIPTDLRTAAQAAIRGRTQRLDLIAAESDGRRYLAVEGVSVGFLALARARYRGANSADIVAGAAAGLAALARFRPLCIGIDADGSAEVTKLGQLFVANLPRYGFGLKVAPQADPADGLLDLVTIDVAVRAALPAMLARLRRGTHLGRPGVRTRRVRRVRIATGGRSPVIADSTNLGTGTVELSVVPAALDLVVPRT